MLECDLLSRHLKYTIAPHKDHQLWFHCHVSEGKRVVNNPSKLREEMILVHCLRVVRPAQREKERWLTSKACWYQNNPRMALQCRNERKLYPHQFWTLEIFIYPATKYQLAIEANISARTQMKNFVSIFKFYYSILSFL